MLTTPTGALKSEVDYQNQHDCDYEVQDNLQQEVHPAGAF